MAPDSKDDKLSAYRKVIDAFEGVLLRYAASLTKNSAAAQDVVQNAFIKLVRTWEGPVEIGKDIGAWLYRVVHNEAVDYIRKEERLAKLHKEHGGECISRESRMEEPGDDAIAAARALDELPPRERELVILKVYEEKSYKEIAEITGLTVSNVGYILHGAMHKLAARLGRKDAK